MPVDNTLDRILERAEDRSADMRAGGGGGGGGGVNARSRPLSEVYLLIYHSLKSSQINL